VKRAHDEAMKQERRRAILEASRRLVEAKGWDGFRLEEVAEALSLVKGTLYRYFPTRQDLLAALMAGEIEAWWAALAGAPRGQPAGAWIVGSLCERTLMLRLLAGLHAGIEAGLSPEGLLELKLRFADFLTRATAEAEARYPALAGRGGVFLLEVYSLAVGAAQLAMPPPPVAALLASRPELTAFRLDLGPFLAAGVDRLYAGHAAAMA
jgi:AcrR family transcriptional regulator